MVSRQHAAGVLALAMFTPYAHAAPRASETESDKRALVSRKAVGEQRVLVILARFPDVTPSFPADQMRSRYFDKLNRYLKGVSHNKAWVAGAMTAWRVLPRPVGHYRISPHNLSVDRQRVFALIQDAIDLVDRDETLARYSMIFISLGAKRSDYGMMGLCGYPGMLGWRRRLPIRTTGRRQAIPDGVAIFCEQAHVGIVFHDMAHIMGGLAGERRVLPCLYDHDLQAKPGPFRGYAQFYLTHVGYFDPMSCHYVKLGQGPPGVCAWTKLRLNWIDRAKTAVVPRGATRTLLLGPLSATRSPLHVVKAPVDADRYYLVENRQPIGPDRNLPSHGVLVSFCDDTVAECRRGQSPVRLVNARPSLPELAGAPFTPEGRSVYEDGKRKIRIRVLSRKGMAYRVRVSNGR